MRILTLIVLAGLVLIPGANGQGTTAPGATLLQAELQTLPQPGKF